MTHSTLHIVSCLQAQQLPPALARSFNPNDAVLLSGATVYIALLPSASLPSACYAMRCDVEARGLLAHWPAHIPLIDHADFVSLSVQHTTSLSWA